MDTSEFLTALWGAEPSGYALVWALNGKRSMYINRFAPPISRRQETDVYTGVGLAHEPYSPHQRTPNHMVCAIAGLWADIDVNGGPDEKTGAAPTWDAAYDLATTTLAAPTILVHSGYGLQAWWLFEEPWRFRTRGEQRQAAKAAAQWQALLRREAGFGIDYTHDLARVMRLPGTLNGKGRERRSVEVIEQGPRHERDDLLTLALQGGDVEPGYQLAGNSTIPEVRVVARSVTDEPAPVVELLRRSPRFRRTWEHQRDDLASMSEIDMALASIAALAGYGDQDIADVIAAHRAQTSDPKGGRVDYLRRTVGRARAGREIAAADTAPSAISTTRAGTYLPEKWAELLRAQLRAQNVNTIPLPFRNLNDALDGGMCPGDVVLVAGYTSHGKSVLVDQIADTAAGAGKRVHMYLTEMTAYERGLRLLARRAHVPFKRLRKRDLTEQDWVLIDGELSRLPYGCSIVSDWSVEDVVAHITEHKWDLAVVDLIHGFSYADERDLSKTSSAIVRAAKATAGADHPGTSIVYAAHLNDGQLRDQRSARRPKPGLHSIKGSSSLKQDADLVLFVWMEDDDEGRPSGIGAVWIAKARQGGLAEVLVRLNAERMLFEELKAA